MLSYRAAHLLASSFNFQGRVKKLFYVLTDDKVGSGPRLKPGVLSKSPEKAKDQDQPMETDPDNSEVAVDQPTGHLPSQPASSGSGLSLAAKLALKRKSDTVSSGQGSQKKVHRP
jgi:hypothetical protein